MAILHKLEVKMSEKQELIKMARSRALEVAGFCSQALDQNLIGDEAGASRSIDSGLVRLKALKTDLLAAQISTVRPSQSERTEGL